MELFPKESVLELNTKNLGNSASFLTVCRTTLSAKRFRKYGILTIDVPVVFCFWTEQRWPKLRKSRILYQKTTLSTF
jgi:hypothetical protein